MSWGKKIQRLRVRRIFTEFFGPLKYLISITISSVVGLLLIVHRKYQKTFIHKRLKRADKWRVRSASAISLLVLVIFVLGLFSEPIRASSTWQQNDWSGGTGSSTSNQYTSATNVDGSSGDSATLNATSNLFTNPTFDSNVDDWNGVYVTHDTVTKHSGAGASKLVAPASGSTPLYSRITKGLPATGTTNSQKIVADDFNNDGIDDAAILQYAASASDPTLHVFTGNNTGTFDSGTPYTLGLQYPIDIVTGDFTGDGYVDLIIDYGTNGSYLNMMVNDGDGTFTQSAMGLSTGNHLNCSLAAFDADNDNDLDLAAKCTYGNYDVKVSKNNGSGVFGSFTSYTATRTTLYNDGIVAVDINGDTYKDLVYEAFSSTPYTCKYGVMLNDGVGGYGSEQLYSLSYCNDTGRVYALEPIDLNHDQYEDIAIIAQTGTTGSATANTQYVYTLTGQSNGTFANEQHYSAMPYASSDLTAGDFNNDGYTDVVSVNTSGDKAIYFQNNQDGTLAAGIDLPEGDNPISGATGDFNGDGRDDLTVANQTDKTFDINISGDQGNTMTQQVNVGDTDEYIVEGYVYTAGSAVTDADAKLFANGEALATTYVDAGSGWYKLTAVVTGADELRGYGILAKPGKTVYVDDMALYKYNSPGVLTSSVFDLGYGGDWGALTYSTSGGGTVEVKVRSDSNSDMSGAADFSTCPVISSGTDLTGQTCMNNNDQYVQYQVTLTYVNGEDPPILNSISIEYSAWDTDLPDTNASNIAMKKESGGDDVSSNGWTNGASPYFSWDAGADNSGGSGVKGYCLYLGQSQGSDPVSTKGLLGTSPLDTDGACQFAVSSEYVNLATAGYIGTALTTSNNPYYLTIKVIDNANNVYGGSVEEFQFRFDDTKPSNPSFVTAPSQFVANKEVSLTWPTSGGDEASDANSGVSGLQYRIGSSTPWYGDTHTSGGNDDADLLTNDGEYTTISDPDFANINEGNNIIYFRTWDNAGNVSTTYTTTVVKLNTSSPSSPQNVTATPSTNTSNSFAFSWEAPSSYQGSASNITYCYTVNTLPTVNTCTYTSAGVTSLSASAFATQPGDNTFYVVAKDEADNVNYATAATRMGIAVPRC